MSAKFIFLIRPLSVDKGFELECDGVMAHPLQFHRLIEAIIATAQIGQGLDAEMHIFNSAGEVIEVLELNGQKLMPA